MRRTLWEAVEAHRLSRVGAAIALALIWLIGVAISALTVLLPLDLLHRVHLGGNSGSPLPRGLAAPLAFVCLVGICTAVAALSLAATLGERNLLRALNAHRITSADSPDTLSALHDMCLAAVVKPVPSLYVTTDPALNALIVGLRADTARIVVTTGLMERSSHSVQRAVFADLLARFREGGVGWTTNLAVLMQPVRMLLERWSDLTRPLRSTTGFSLVVVTTLISLLFAYVFGRLLWGPAFFWALMLLAASVPASICCLWATFACLDLSYRGAYRRLAFNADADSVMLLRDPAEAAAALTAITSQATWLVAGHRYAYLTYADASLPRPKGVASKVDRARLERLEELAFPAAPIRP